MSPESNQNPSLEPVQQMYFNGFQLGVGAGDVVLTLTLNGREQIRTNMSFTLAKTLEVKLREAIGLLEKHSGKTIMTSDDVTRYIEEVNKTTSGQAS
jgi:hypothetical protein